MNPKGKVALVTIPVAIAAFLLASHGPLGRVLWPAPVELAASPTGMQLTLFILLDALDALAFGLGLAFILFAWPTVKQVAGPSTGRAVVMYVSTAWFLSNWWVHDNFHMVMGLRPGGLLGIEYGFHVTLEIAGAALAYTFTLMARAQRGAGRV